MSGAGPLDVVELAPGDVPPTPEGLLDRLRGPTVFRRSGRDDSRLRVAAGLLHGSEPSGLSALHAALRCPEPPAVDLLLFLGAVEAARTPPRFTHRMLPARRDLNRCFRPPFEGPDGAIAREALRLLCDPRLEAALDLHNNSGSNPVYAIGERLDGRRLGLGALFGTRFVHSQLRLGTLAEALDEQAPTVTIECGRSGEPASDAVAIRGLLQFMGMPTLSAATPDAMEVLIDPVRVRLRGGLSLAFSATPVPSAALTLDPEIDRHNFQVLEAGTALGWVAAFAGWPLVADEAGGGDVSHQLFCIEEGVLRSTRPFVPMMMTVDAAAAMADCLFYVAQPRGR